MRREVLGLKRSSCAEKWASRRNDCASHRERERELLYWKSQSSLPPLSARNQPEAETSVPLPGCAPAPVTVAVAYRSLTKMAPNNLPWRAHTVMSISRWAIGGAIFSGPYSLESFEHLLCETLARPKLQHVYSNLDPQTFSSLNQRQCGTYLHAVFYVVIFALPVLFQRNRAGIFLIVIDFHYVAKYLVSASFISTLLTQLLNSAL